MTEIGWASLAIAPTFKDFDRQLEAGTSRGMVVAGRSGGSRFGSAFKTAAKAALVGGVVAGALAAKLGKESIREASALNESLNAVNVTYEEQAKAVKKLGREAADSLGLSNTEFNSLSVRFSAFSKTIAGGDGKKVVGTLDDLTTRAADFASVMNLEVNEAAELFQSGLAGETEPLRKFGIDLSAAAVEAHALKLGMDVASEGLTESQKVQARYSLLMEKTSKAQGDFANTSDQLANRQRILGANVDNLQAKLGKALLPVTEQFVGFLVDDGVPAVERFSDWFTDKGIPAIGNFKDEIEPLAKDLIPALGDAFEVVRGAVEASVPFIKDIIEGFNNLPDGVKKGLLVGGGLYAGSKLLGGGSSGRYAERSFTPTGLIDATKSAVVNKTGELLAGRLLERFQKPLLVTVTNPGFGAAGAAAPGAVGAAPGAAAKGARPKISKAGKVGAVALIASVFGEQIIDEVKSELLYPISDESPVKTQAEFLTAFAKLVTPGGGPGVTSGVGNTISGAFKAAANDVERMQKKLPKTIATRFELLGVPKTEADLKRVLAAYDLTPKQKRTTLELLGYDVMLDRIARVNKELDWAARPREARIDITRAYSAAGYETRGGLQQYGGGPIERSRRRSAGGVP